MDPPPGSVTVPVTVLRNSCADTIAAPKSKRKVMRDIGPRYPGATLLQYLLRSPVRQLVGMSHACDPIRCNPGDCGAQSPKGVLRESSVEDGQELSRAG